MAEKEFYNDFNFYKVDNNLLEIINALGKRTIEMKNQNNYKELQNVVEKVGKKFVENRKLLVTAVLNQIDDNIIEDLKVASNQYVKTLANMSQKLIYVRENIITNEVIEAYRGFVDNCVRELATSIDTKSVKTLYKQNLKNISCNIDEINNVLKTNQERDYNEGNGGSAYYSDKKYEKINIQKEVKECLNEIGFVDGEKVNFFKIVDVKELEKNKNPLVLNIILSIIIGVLIMIISPFYGDYYNKLRSKDNTEALRQIKKTVNRSFDKEFLKNYRFISADNLDVRAKSTTKSSVVGKLYLGNVVKVIYKKRNWILVEYEDQDSFTYIKGWVFTRYTKKFN